MFSFLLYIGDCFFSLFEIYYFLKFCRFIFSFVIFNVSHCFMDYWAKAVMDYEL
uniref:Uncharacterized protein n=1 Tax=Octopus bimaculoides TaxID=37653 RepID=A0A0L8HTM1_OCTBM